MKKQKKALFCAFAAAVSLAAAIPAVSYAAEADGRTASTETGLPGDLDDANAFGWVKDERGSLFYRDDSGELLTGEQEIDGELYLFAKNGVLKTGWRTVGGVRRYYHINDGTADHGKPVYGWVTDSGKRFYVSKENGKLSGCTVEDDGKLYYLLDKGDAADEEMFINAGDKQYYVTADGTLAAGSLEIDGITYTFGEDGVIRTGWVSADDKEYYFSPEDGTAQIGWLTFEDGKYYVTKENGKATGIFAIEGVAYDFGEDGKVKSGWVEYNGTKRCFNEDGTFKTGLCSIEGEDYVFAKSGLLAKGLIVVDGKIYFTDADGKAQKGRIKIDSDAYLFGEDYSAVTGIVSLDGDRYIFGTDGIMLKGLTEYQGKTYYLGEDGKMLTGRIRIGSDKYYFNENGEMSTGLLTIDSNKYFFGDDGKMAAGFMEIDGKTYFFNAETGAMSFGRIRVGSDKYYFTEDGSMFTGLATLSDGKYFFGADGKMTTGWQEIDGKKYYFDPNSGAMVTNKVVGDYNLTADGSAVGLSALQNRAKQIIAGTDGSMKGSYDFVRRNNQYRQIESTRSLSQIQSMGWSYFAEYALNNRFIVCYYYAAVLDLLYQQMGYQTRIVYGTGHYESEHYWNQVLVNGTWYNYDACNGYFAVSDDFLKSQNYTWYQTVTAKYY